jgi:hypothetical protein
MRLWLFYWANVVLCGFGPGFHPNFFLTLRQSHLSKSHYLNVSTQWRCQFKITMVPPLPGLGHLSHNHNHNHNRSIVSYHFIGRMGLKVIMFKTP